ncbi:hypothetical protein MKW98_003773 [Papaver atlanticum]|uniref:Uncharacterized protein n=1 Tax=Papaver atlanticum TaxID=357466 RepID=A0AAD4T806_9MAGN|nr:hypothetical protein MKW98_003773 [Papaver atlanticum]
MAISKNKRTSKGEKGGKKIVNFFLPRKIGMISRHHICFSVRNAGKTLGSKTRGTKLQSTVIRDSSTNCHSGVETRVVVDDLELEIAEVDGVNVTRLGIVTYNASVRHSDEYTTGIEYTCR